MSRWPNAKRTFASAEERLHELRIAARKQVMNMRARLAQVRWALILTTSVLVYLVTLVLGLAVSFPLLAVFGGGRLDSSRAFQVSFLMTALLLIAVTAYGALWVARRVERAPLLHGVLVGLVVALLSFLLDLLFRPVLEPTGLILYALMIAAGALGGVWGSALGRRRREQS
jgi:putative membrane protein (TIGR04086 family)